ncbi:MAG: flavin mononucleotide-binding protein [Flavobacteriales bacterium]|nr:MAG: flavin mononucleotide-binding protein [Flavobacteriales bacterium]
MTDLTSNEGIRILKNNYIGHLGYISQSEPYVIPITYYYNPSDNTIISYSEEGHKINAMRKNGSVSLQVEEIVSNSNWQSVLAHGTYEEIKGSNAKHLLHLFAEGVKNILNVKEHKHPEFISEFSSKTYSGGVPVVYRIKIRDIKGKRKET